MVLEASARRRLPLVGGATEPALSSCAFGRVLQPLPSSFSSVLVVECSLVRFTILPLTLGDCPNSVTRLGPGSGVVASIGLTGLLSLLRTIGCAVGALLPGTAGGPVSLLSLLACTN